MRVLILASQLHVGAAELLAVELATNLNKNGIEAELASMYSETMEWAADSRSRILADGVPQVHFLGLPVRVHRLIAPALGRVAARLEEARKRDRSLEPFLRRLAGGFAERKIAGTDRASAHAFGIAIDLDKSMSDYWRWQKTKPLRWRNRIPQAIVDAFEAEGFIWGGRWYHYDTMHFEYRPELLDDWCRVSAASDNRRQ